VSAAATARAVRRALVPALALVSALAPAAAPAGGSGVALGVGMPEGCAGGWRAAGPRGGEALALVCLAPRGFAVTVRNRRRGAALILDFPEGRRRVPPDAARVVLVSPGPVLGAAPVRARFADGRRLRPADIAVAVSPRR